MPDAKFVQIAVAAVGDWDSVVYALDSDGNVWCYHRSDPETEAVTRERGDSYWYSLETTRKPPQKTKSGEN